MVIKELMTEKHPFKTSLVVATYNWEAALDLVLRSVARQVEMPDEVIVADDGSRETTARLVHDWSARLPVPLIHVWQPDDGFRLARVRNRAIASASGDYIIFVDGDMVLNSHFVADHKRAARPGYFIQGARLLTGPDAGRRLLDTHELDLGFFSRDIRRRRHTLRSRLLSWFVYQPVRRSQKAIRGCNQAFWRKDLIAVNGFNEAMTGWGGEDNEIAARLYNIGVYRRNLKFAGLAIHIHHRTRAPQGDNPNHRILSETIASATGRCAMGVDAHIAELFRS